MQTLILAKAGERNVAVAVVHDRPIPTTIGTEFADAVEDLAMALLDSNEVEVEVTHPSEEEVRAAEAGSPTTVRYWHVAKGCAVTGAFVTRPVCGLCQQRMTPISHYKPVDRDTDAYHRGADSSLFGSSPSFYSYR